MFFKKLCLALVASWCSAPVAQSATIIDVDMILRYDGTVYVDGYLVPDEAEMTAFDSYLANDNMLGIPTFDRILQPGQQTSFQASLVLPDPDKPLSKMFDNGGRALTCQLGQMTCGHVTEVYQTSDKLIAYWGEQTGIVTDLTVGGKLSYQFTPSYTDSILEFEWGWMVFDDRFANFTILSIGQPAPVPVPVSAALLPMGIGALALLRRRRRRSS